MDVESDSIKEIDFVEVDAEENIGMVYFKLVKEDETDGKHIAEFDLIIENKVINVSSMDIKISYDPSKVKVIGEKINEIDYVDIDIENPEWIINKDNIILNDYNKNKAFLLLYSFEDPLIVNNNIGTISFEVIDSTAFEIDIIEVNITEIDNQGNIKIYNKFPCENFVK